MLEKLMSDLNEMNRLAQLYYKEKQWALFEKVMDKIKNTTNMINNYLMKNELEIGEEI
tara:strand:+ start:603 stop:776 length:174 start_codon:yes stop_codon:yes gene_type:complete